MDEHECICCRDFADDLDGATNLCVRCLAERDAHPVWQAIQRVERGEVTVTRYGDLDPGAFGNYQLKTCDGWIFEVFPDGKPFDDWDYIASATSPDGTRWETYSHGDPPVEHGMPMSVWTYGPWDEHRGKWTLKERPTFAEMTRRAFTAIAELVLGRAH